MTNHFTDEGWFLVDADGKLMPFTHALDLLLTTRLELKQARERVAEVESNLQSKTVTAAQLSREVTRLIDHRIASHHASPPETQAPSLAGKRPLDLRGLVTNATQFDQTIWLSKLLGAIRAQLPDVEVIV